LRLGDDVDPGDVGFAISELRAVYEGLLGDSTTG
jgi:hypothetical protein